ncbi:MAG: hypothetical protein KHX45_20570 [Clostridiales bacterium]|nr:hypothetical protein [Clostridiales bacterium]DAJ91050.1 MAG TPA: hypothetical protein [Caudoviricetes sp.]
MKVSDKYFEVLNAEGFVTFFWDDDFVAEFMQQCRTKGLKVKKIQCNGYLKIERIRQYRFYVQEVDFDYTKGVWYWKTVKKAETVEEAKRLIPGGKTYNSAGDRIYRILDRQSKHYIY